MIASAYHLARIVLLLLFAVGATGAYAQQTASDGNVALVNGQAITRAAYQTHVAHLKQQALQRGGQLGDAAVKKIEKDALDSLINQELLYTESQKAGVKVASAAVQAQLDGFKGQFSSDAEYQKALKDRDLTPAYLSSQIERGLAIREYISAHIVDKIQIQETEVRKFYDSNPKLFQQPEMIRARHILIKVDADASEAQKSAASKKIAMIQQKLDQGEDFAALAGQFSEGPSRAQGGDLGFFKRGQMVPPFEQAAFALDAGQVSEMVTTRFGYHLILVTDKKQPGSVDYPEAQERIMAHLKRIRADQQIRTYIDKLRDAADIKVMR